MYFDEAENFVPTSRHIFFRGGRPPVPGEDPIGHYTIEHEHGDLSLPT